MSESSVAGERAKLRRRAGLTQAELALRVGMHAPQICLWERHQLVLRKEQEERIAAVLREHIAHWLKSLLTGEHEHAVSQ
jgi:transcriptional regulator with XRE-family HTH domain